MPENDPLSVKILQQTETELSKRGYNRQLVRSVIEFLSTAENLDNQKIEKIIQDFKEDSENETS